MSKRLFLDLASTAPGRVTPAEVGTIRSDLPDVCPFCGQRSIDCPHCPKCGKEVPIGGSSFCRDNHERPAKGYGDGFEAYFDYGLGKQVTGWGDIHKTMREEHLDFRDHPNAEKTERFQERARRAQEARR